jgi:uncharacterized membrane protein
MIRWIHRKTMSSPRLKIGLAMLGVLCIFGMAAVVRAATAPGFSVSAAPPSQTINSGSSTSYAVTISPTNGFTGTVTLTAGTLPKGTAASWTVGATTTSSASVQVTVPAGSRGVAATLTIGGGQPPAGTYSPTVTATSGSLSSTAKLTLVVLNQNAANFSLSVSPFAQTVVQGTSSVSTVSITRTNWTGSVSLGPVTGLTGATATLTPSSTTGATAVLTVAVPSSAQPGLYTLTLTGSAVLSGKSASTRYTAFTLLVLGATTTTVAAPASDTTNTAIAASSFSSTLAGATSGATGTITFKVFGPQTSPPVTCAIGGTTVGTATVSGNGTYNPSAGYTPTSAGTYWSYARYSGDLYDSPSSSGCGSGMVSTIVKNATTTTAAAPATATATAAIPASSIIAALSGGATSPAAGGSITFYLYGPSSTVPTTCPGATKWSTVGSAMVSGNGTYHPSAGYTPTVGGTYWWYASYSGDALNNGSSSTCNNSSMTSTTVRDFSVSASPSSQTALTGGTGDDSASYTVTVAPLGGYAGAVSLSAGGLPTGVTASFSPTSTSTASTLTLDVGTNVATGTHTFTVQGTAMINGTAVMRSTQVTLVVNSSSPFTISGDVPNPLYPGAPAQSFPLKLTNPNSFPLTVTSLGSVSVQAKNALGCLSIWFKISLPSIPVNGISLAANGGSATLTATAQMLDVNAPQDACKAQQLTLSYSGGVAQK